MPNPVAQHTFPSGQQLTLYQADITTVEVVAIVNAANAQLAHGGGVAGAIVSKGGRNIQQESTDWVRQHGPASHEKPALTGAGRLPCQAIIHAVGPIWRGGKDQEESKLQAAYRSALRLAHQRGFASIAFPSISTGIFGFPVEKGAAIAVQAVADFCTAEPTSPLRAVWFTIIDAPTVGVFAKAFGKL